MNCLDKDALGPSKAILVVGMRMKALSKLEWLKFVDRLVNDSGMDIIGVKAKGESFVFDRLKSADELRLDHDVTILPPKKVFLPVTEDLISYDLKGQVRGERTVDDRKRVLIGVHPYDVIAIEQMDEVYLGNNIDEHYASRRLNTLIIASDIINVSERSFAASLGTHVTDSGYDLLVTDIGDTVVVDVGSKEGRALLKKYGKARDASKKEVDTVKCWRSDLPTWFARRAKLPPSEWKRVLDENHDHPVWDENSKKCLTCGTCTTVCPTCYCYDVDDRTDLNLKEGKRQRTWDGCLLRDFTLVGSGEIFRDGVKERYRHRFYRKGAYFPDRKGFVACVGCGRCAYQCLPDIADPSEVINSIASYNLHKKEEHPVPPVEHPEIREDLLIPEPATIIRKQKMTDLETLYVVRLDSGKELGHAPGQFVQVSLYGIGEAPISISSAPGGKEFELLVRRVGDVTGAMEKLKEGDKIGVRGPYGRGFDPKEMQGKDMLFISGGCGLAPMRSLIDYTMGHRKDFKDVWILYGCKEPAAILFSKDLKQWADVENVKVLTTVDKCPDGQCWDGNIGVITTLIPKVAFDPKTTIAVIVGPPIMYKFVIRDLKSRGMPDENIIVSLERRMKCGVGKCGHCQMNGIYCCIEGPVFKYSEVKNIPEAF